VRTHHRCTKIWGVHMLSRQFCKIVFSATLFFCLCPFAHGQTTYGSVTGFVADTTGAAVVGATVTLTNVATSHKTTQPSGSDGRFVFVNLVPGTYQIDVEKQGFKHFTRTDVLVQVNQSTSVDASLPVGQTSETVEVTGSTPRCPSARPAKPSKSPAQHHCFRPTLPRWARWSRNATLLSSP